VGEKGLDDSLKEVSARVLVVAFTSDWLYTPAQNKLIVEALHRLGKEGSYLEIDHKHGHDSFLIKSKAFLRSVRVFLNGIDDEEKEEQNADRFRQVENRYEVKKEADFKVIDNWVQPSESVLDLGCGRGILLEYLRDTKQVRGLGVDYDGGKVTSSIARGVAVYQEDIRRALGNLGDQSFDWVIFSRMIDELPQPGSVLLEALRVGKRVALSFVNHGYWRNRLHFLGKGMKIKNDVYPDYWEKSGLMNHFSISEFESFCRKHRSGSNAFEVGRKIYHQGDWVKTCSLWPNLRAGLAIYELSRK
jgi:methionine biosynthesis protein MetW